MHDPLRIFIGTVYPRFADMNAERTQRLYEHSARITLIHEHLSKRHDVAIANPLNDATHRTSDAFPSISLYHQPGISDDAKAAIQRDRVQETIRRDLWLIRKADIAIIDLTYLEGNPEFTTLVAEADLLEIPLLLTRFGKTAVSPYQSIANHRRFVACYTTDFELLAHIDDALVMLFPIKPYDENTDPQIPSKLIELRRRGA